MERVYRFIAIMEAVTIIILLGLCVHLVGKC